MNFFQICFSFSKFLWTFLKFVNTSKFCDFFYFGTFFKFWNFPSGELFFCNLWTFFFKFLNFFKLATFPNFVKFFSNQWNVLKSQRSTDLVRGQRSMASRSTIYPFKKNSNPCVFLFANFFFHIFKYYKKAGSRKNRTKKTIERLTIVRANEWME